VNSGRPTRSCWAGLIPGNSWWIWGEQRNKDRFSNTTRYRFRGIYPFYSTATGKWFFDVCFNYTTAGDKDFGYTPVDYYFSIPGGEVSKSPVIDQQPNR
jgi:hypothetical protein